MDDYLHGASHEGFEGERKCLPSMPLQSKSVHLFTMGTSRGLELEVLLLEIFWKLISGFRLW